MLENRTVTETRPPRQRSAVTNRPLRRVSGNTAAGRRLRDLYGAFLQHMSNPADTIAQANALNAAELTVAVEQARLAAARGEAVDIDALVRLSNLADRAVRRLRLQPGAVRSSEPDLTTYLRQISTDDEGGASEAVDACFDERSVETPAEAETLTCEAVGRPGNAK
jgi:hypothetical protein